MSEDEKDQESTRDDQHAPSADDQKAPSADDLSDEGKEKVEQMRAAYDDDRPTAVLPGTDNTITGVAVNEWLDDDGNPKFGQDEKPDEKQQDDKAQDDKAQDDKAQDDEQQEEAHRDEAD